jgi:hypothetical protein
MQDNPSPSPLRPTRRRIGILVTLAVVIAVAVLATRGHGAEPASAAARPTTATTGVPTPTTTPPTTTPPPSTTTPAPTTSPAPSAPAAPEPDPAPILADGRHPVFLTDIDVEGGTVEFDLVQILTPAEQEAYEADHPTEHAGCGCDDGGPLHDDNPRLRRLPIATDVRVFAQGTTPATCEGQPPLATFAALPGYLSDGDRDYAPGTGHLGSTTWWLTVAHDTVVEMEEMPCA